MDDNEWWKLVAPLAGAWIEMVLRRQILPVIPGRSPCGSVDRNANGISYYQNPPLVAPLAGAWIEIVIIYKLRRSYKVAPLAGAWIEMFDLDDVAK